MFTDEEREIIRQKRKKLVREERLKIRENCPNRMKGKKIMPIKNDFFYNYTLAIPLAILSEKYSGHQLERAKIVYEHKEEPKAEVKAERLYEKMEEEEGLIAVQKHEEYQMQQEAAGFCVQPQEKEPDAGAAADSEKTPSHDTKIWTARFCPSCGQERIEWIRRKDFAGKAGIKPHTVTSRVRRGKYFTRADKRIPWCTTCRVMTPEGEGNSAQRQRIFTPPEDHQRELMEWCNEIFFERNMLPQSSEDNDEIISRCQEEVGVALQDRRRNLMRNEVEEIIESEIIKYIKEKKASQSRKLDLSPDEFQRL